MTKHSHKVSAKAEDFSEITNGTRYYTAWRGTFIFPAPGSDPFSDDGEKIKHDARVIWAGHYSDTHEHALERQKAEAPNLNRAVKGAPGGFEGEMKPDGIVAVHVTDGIGSLRNRPFVTPIGGAFCLEGEMMDEEPADGETAVTDTLDDNPMPGGLVGLLAAMAALGGPSNDTDVLGRDED